MRRAGNVKRWQAVVVWMGVLAGASAASAQTVDPCDIQVTSTDVDEITGAGLEMPVPNVGSPNTSISWQHFRGSTEHKRLDTHALDLNLYNNPSWNFDRMLPALASAAGTVRFAGWSTCGYGYNVMVEHPLNESVFYTHYAHLAETLLVSEGDTVSQGQALGYISATGLNDINADHLHWSVRQGTTARHATVNGQSTEEAHDYDLDLQTDTRMIWLDEFTRPENTWQNVSGSTATVERKEGQLLIRGPGTVQHKATVYVNDSKRYRVKYAIRTDKLRSGQPASASLRLECLPNAASTTQQSLHTLYYPFINETFGGWQVFSIPLTFGASWDMCPVGTRFVRPILATNSHADAEVFVDWVGLEENPPLWTQVVEQFTVYTYGGVRRFSFSLADTQTFSTVELVGATTRTGQGAQVVCQFSGATGSGSCTQPMSTSLPSFYTLRLRTSEGQYRDLGFVGPVEPYTRAVIPGLGKTQVKALNLRPIPSWVDYPFTTFDNSINNYGIVNYASNAVDISFTPEVPVANLKTFEAYYGGNPTRATVSAVDHATGNLVTIGTVDSVSLGWGTLTSTAWPATTREIRVRFQRLTYDYYLHIDEIRFSTAP